MMAKVYWQAKANLFPLLLFFVRFSSGLASFLSGFSPLLPLSSALCFLFVLYVFLVLGDEDDGEGVMAGQSYFLPYTSVFRVLLFWSYFF